MLISVNQLQAQTTFYTDFQNGASASFGTNASFNWGVSGGTSVWNSTASGAGSGAAWTNATTPNNAVLGAGSGTSSYVATLTSAVNVGTIAVTNGTWSIATAGFALTFNSPTNSTLPATISGTGSVTKAGSSTLTFSSANSYTGTTTVSAGVLNIRNATALGTVAGGTSVSSGAALELQGGITVGAEALTLNGTGVSNNGALRNISGTNSFAGAITLGSATEIQSDAGTLTLSGNISGATQNLTVGGAGNTTISGIIGTTSGTLTKTDAGTLTLTGANTYTGATTISAGVLNIQNATALGTTAGSTAVTSGAALELQGGITVGAEALTLNGTGVSSGGALRNVSGTNSYAGAISLGSAARINSDSGALTLSGGITGTQNLTVGGAGNTTVSGVIGTSTGTVTKDGAGVVTFAGANTYTGATTVSAGTLRAGVASVANTSGAFGNNSAVSLANASGAILDLNGFNTQIGSLTGGGTTGGNVSLGSATLTVGGNNTSPAAYAGIISGTGALSKIGSGTLTLSGANTFTGGVSIASGGIISAQSANALGAGTTGTTVASGGALAFQSGSTLAIANNGTLTLNGTGVSSSGALYNSGGDNQWNGNISLGSATTINATAGTLRLGNVSSGYTSHTLVAPTDTNTLALGANTLTLGGSGGTTWVNSRITGTGNIIVDNLGGTVNYNAYMNTYTGTTTVKAGTLDILTIDNQEPGNATQGGFYAINGPLVIGDGSGSLLSAVVNIGTSQNEVLNYTTTLTMNNDGRLHLAAVQTIGAITFNGGKIDIDIGGLYLDNTVTVNAGTGNVSSIDTTSTGQLSLTRHFGPGGGTNANRIFDVGDATSSTASDLNISAQVAAGSITKNGSGTMTLNGTIANIYEGTTTINNGVLNIQKNTALGGATNTSTDGTTVNGNGTTNGTLQLQNNITVSNENLYINNTGFNNLGALNNTSGNNTWAGLVELQSNARIASDAGLLTLSGTVNTSSGYTLDVRGVSDTTISGSLTGSGNLVKNDSGKLILSGTNTFSGTTVVNAGTLSMQNNAALGGIGSTTVNSGAVLELDSTANGNITGGDNTTTVTGTGIGGTGVIRNVVGTNNYTGQVTLAGSSLITANSGTALTLSGGITGTQALTVGTTAQNGNVTVSGAITNGTGTLTKAGSGNLTFANSAGVTGTVGDTHLNAGTLTVGQDGGTQTLLNTGAIDSASGTVLKIGSAGKVIANYASGNTNMFGTIDEISASGGTFEKTGAGTLTFNTSFNFAGNLILSGGTLALANGANVTVGNIYITANMTIDFGSGTSTILSSANLYIAAGVQVSVINWVNNGAGGSDDIWYATNAFNNYTGTPSSPTLGTSAVMDAIGSAPENQITFTGIAPAANTSWVTVQGGQYYDHEIRPIPEPSTYGAIFFGGCLALFGWRRYRVRQARN